MVKLTKQQAIDAIVDAVLDSENPMELFEDALREGRSGYNDMSNDELLDACEVWGVECDEIKGR